MLVLDRKLHEKILLDLPGVRITLTVVRISEHSIRLGIDAPRTVEILRPKPKVRKAWALTYLAHQHESTTLEPNLRIFPEIFRPMSQVSQYQSMNELERKIAAVFEEGAKDHARAGLQPRPRA
jgi:carbon storage regulator CsrA